VAIKLTVPPYVAKRLKASGNASAAVKALVDAEIARTDNKVNNVEIENKSVQVDMSGQGRAWHNATADTCPANIQDEIAAEIIDGGKETSDGYTASNGQRYRWS
jgi:hypothetical protein